MKRAYVKTRLLYRRWIRYINSPASTEEPTITTYIVCVAIAAAIVIKMKPVIEEKLFPPKQEIILYYDWVPPGGDYYQLIKQ